MNWIKEKIRLWLGISQFNQEVIETLEAQDDINKVTQSISDDVGVLIEEVQKLKDYTGITDNEEFMSYGGTKAE